MPTFIACPSCARHVRSDDEACPFCGAAQEMVGPIARSVAKIRLVSLLAIAACAYGLPPPKMDAGVPTDSHAATDGQPASDAPPVDAH